MFSLYCCDTQDDDEDEKADDTDDSGTGKVYNYFLLTKKTH